MDDLYLRAKLAGVDIAISSEMVESVVRIGDVVPVPAAAPVVAGLFALRSRVLTLIDSQYCITGERGEIAPGHHAIVSQIGGHNYGFLVDTVEDVVTIDADAIGLFGRLDPQWSGIATGMASKEDRTLLVIDLGRIVAPKMARAA